MPVVPVRLEGLDRVLHHVMEGSRRAGTARVRVRRAYVIEGNDYAALAAQVEAAVRGDS